MNKKSPCSFTAAAVAMLRVKRHQHCRGCRTGNDIVKRQIAVLFISLVGLIISVPTARPATITWTNTSGGNWSDAADWSPNEVPSNTDTVLITTPGTYTVALDISGEVTNLTLGAGGGAAGVQTLVATNVLDVKSLLLVTAGGVLNSSGDSAGFSGAMTIATGGVLNLAAGYNDFTFTANPLIVGNGGVVSAGGSPLYGGYGGTENYYGSTIYGTVIVAGGGVLNSRGASVAAGFTVASGGEVNVNSLGLGIEDPMTNSGTINLTDGQLGDENYNTVDGAAYGELVNQQGGVINLQGSTTIGGGGNIVNQGAIVQSAGTNAVNSPVFDNRLGTITNLSGIVTLSLFQTNLTGTYFAASGATIQFEGADIDNDNSASQLTLGTPLVLSGSGEYQLTSGYLYLPANVPTNLELLGDTVELGPAFQGGSITNLSLYGMGLLNALPITGTFTATNSDIGTNLVVADGGVFSYEGVGLVDGTVAVGSGGVFNIISSAGNVYVDILLDHGVTVERGGILNGEGLFTSTTLTNAGIFNLSASLYLSTSTNGIVNLPGGEINLGSNVVITIAATNDYFINQGVIVQNAGSGATNLIYVNNAVPVFDFDNTQGTISNLSGTLSVAGIQGPLAGTFYAATGATIQLSGGTVNGPLVPGAFLSLGGGGQYQLISGYLFVPANVPPNLALLGGLLELGSGFQGGAITNLTLDGIELTNQSSTTLPIKGIFTVLNSGGYVAGSYGTVYLLNTGVPGNYSVADGGLLSLSNAAMYGSVTVGNGGVVYADAAILDGDVSVAGGGTLNSIGSSSYAGVTVAGGGVFNSLDSYYAVLGRFGPSSSMFGPLTNSGTINMTNSGIGIYNDGTTNYQGSLMNLDGGLIDFFGDSAVGGSGYLVNQGRIIKSAGTSFSGFDLAAVTNSGTITAETGPMVLGNQWISLPGSSLNVVLNSATNFGSFIISTNFPSLEGNAGLAGTFNATLESGYVPTNGTIFSVVSYGSLSGSFSGIGLPADITWQSSFGSTNFTLVAGSGSPGFTSINHMANNLIFNGTGGTAGSNYIILSSSNLSLPLTEWTALITNAFDDTGQFHYTNNASPAKPREFFILKLP